MNPKQKILFFKWGNFSYINDNVFRILSTNFSEFVTEAIDIGSELQITMKDPMILSHCLKLYGLDLLLGRKTISKVIFRTPYVFNRIKKSLMDRFDNKNLAFTFQTQSLFDASIPGIPHFVYTDNTHLANLSYPGFHRGELVSASWIECEKKIYHNATLNFTMSSNITRSIIEDYSCSPNKVSYVYSGVNVLMDNGPVDAEKYSNKNLLFVGVDWERKGGPVLVEAFQKVLRILPETTLTIVGCSPRFHLNNCKVIGKVPLAAVHQYYKFATIFCLPTVNEPFGIVFLEAMAYNLPVIGSKIGAIPDFIIDGSNGYLVEPFNSQQLSEKIIDLISLPDKCKSFGEYGHKLVLERYTWEKTGERIRQNIEKFIP